MKKIGTAATKADKPRLLSGSITCVQFIIIFNLFVAETKSFMFSPFNIFKVPLIYLNNPKYP
jgi:hypothetical protein